MKFLFVLFFCYFSTFVFAQKINTKDSVFITAIKMQNKYHISGKLILANFIIFSDATQHRYDRENVFGLRDSLGNFIKFTSLYASFDEACKREIKGCNVFLNWQNIKKCPQNNQNAQKYFK